MSQKTIQKFGTWKSEITVDMVSAGVRLGDLDWDDETGQIVWSEGRSAKTDLRAQALSDKNPRIISGEVNVRAEVGYGGGAFSSSASRVFYVEAKTAKIFSTDLISGNTFELDVKEGSNAAPQLSPCKKWVLYINRDKNDRDCLAIASSSKSEPTVSKENQILNDQFDFYRQARWSSDGKYISFISWDHPSMPWINSKVYVAEVTMRPGEAPKVGEAKCIETDTECANFQPEFSNDGKFLYFIRDTSGWGQLYSYELASGIVKRKSKLDGECGMPNWIQEMRTYGLSKDGKFAYVACGRDSKSEIYKVCLSVGVSEKLTSGSPWTDISQIKVSPDGRNLAFLGSAPDLPPQVVVADTNIENVCVLSKSFETGLAESVFTRPRHLKWKTVGGDFSNGIFWPPQNPKYEGEKGVLPPVVVRIHGGPTSQARTAWEPDAQFFTSRGIAVFHVNHRGSTGYGRKYMDDLKGEWGVYDVEDSVSGLEYLVREGLVDPKRSAIMGGSAGGYTVLQTMVNYPEAFAAGISLYGIGDLFALNDETHKFEQHYNDYLIGELPEAKDKFYNRSPKNFVDKIKRPVAIFQGEDDTVVPPNQAEMMVESLKKNEVPHIYHLYKGEGHGFRKQETKEHFYGAIINFIDDYLG